MLKNKHDTLATLPRGALDQHHQDLALSSVQWMDTHWDASCNMLRSNITLPQEKAIQSTRYDIRGTARYALGLLLRNQHDDSGRAVLALESVLAHQIIAPGLASHGTFARMPEEMQQPENPQVWSDYDPNWREFIGTTLFLILDTFSDELPPDLVARIEDTLRIVVETSVAREVDPSYTNIALLSAYLCNYAGNYFNEASWSDYGEKLGSALFKIYQETETFEEYNSPTYYSVDLIALAYWRSYAPSARLREYGEIMEKGLWKQIGDFYHAGLKNMSGPYVRAYGMDMQRYLAALTLWLWTVLGKESVPLPDLATGDNAHSFTSGPIIAILGSRVPQDVKSHLIHFQGERVVERKISLDPIIVSSWQSEACMLGGICGKNFVAPQLHAATAHWKANDATVNCLYLALMQGDRRVRRHSARINARARQGVLTIHTEEDVSDEPKLDAVFHVYAPGIETACITRDRWEFPGLTLFVHTDAGEPVLVKTDYGLEIRYAAQKQHAKSTMLFTLSTSSGAED